MGNPESLSASEPNFLIIGPPKSATTFLHYALSQHPEVFLTRKKETRFFAFQNKQIDSRDPVNQRVITNYDSYLKAFTGSASFLARGEVSPVYLGSPMAPENINDKYPNMRFIAILRQPAERAFSHFLFAKQQGYEPWSATFEDALFFPTVRYRGFTRERPYLRDSLYGEAVSRYLRYFPRENFLFLRYENIRNDWQKSLKQVEKFLGINYFGQYVKSDSLAASGEPRSRIVYSLARSRYTYYFLRAFLGRQQAKVKQANFKKRLLIRRHLTCDEWEASMQFFRSDIESLEAQLGLDLADWLVPPQS